MPCFDFLGVEICIPTLDDITNAVLAPSTDWVTAQVSWIWDQISPKLALIEASIGGVVELVISEVTLIFQDPLTYVQTKLDTVGLDVSMIGPQIIEATSGIIPVITSGVADLSNEFWAGVGDLSTSIGEGLEGLGSSFAGLLDATQNTMITMFDGAFSLVGDTVFGLFQGFGAVDVDTHMGDLFISVSAHINTLRSLVLPSSPITPEGAYSLATTTEGEIETHFQTMYRACLLTEAISLGQVETGAMMMWREPTTAMALGLYQKIWDARTEAVLLASLKRYWLSQTTPYLPAYADMIAVYVKEGYLPEKWVELPAEFTAYMTELGYSDFWTKRLWGKHWVLPAVGQLYEMYHRTMGTRPDIGVTLDVLRTLLKYHDYEPIWRDRFEAISWRTWRIYDLRVGWETQILSDEELEAKSIDQGYDPKEAPDIALVQKMFVIRSELDRLLSEADTDFIDGWIDLTTLTANYDATPYREEIKSLRIERAKMRRDRELRKEEARALEEDYKKRVIEETTFRTEMLELGMQRDFLDARIKYLKRRRARLPEETA